MAQYWRLKEAHPGSLLFFQMGDFYELFFDDAVRASQALDIALTRRGKHDGQDIPMCGVPIRAADAYLARLTRKGFKVAVCNQSERPEEARRRGTKAVVRRDVDQVVTQGTLTAESLLDGRTANYLAALARAGGGLALGWLDVSTGEFTVAPCDGAGLESHLARIGPGELLVPEPVLQNPDFFDLFRAWKSALTPQPTTLFDSEAGKRRLKELYGVSALDAFGQFGRAELAACGALVAYVELTQKGRLPRLAPPRLLQPGSRLAMDAATLRNLELVAKLSGERSGSLLAVIDRTLTGAGARLLSDRLTAPLTDSQAINHRLDMVDHFVTHSRLRREVREGLHRCPDVARSLSRLTLGRGGPRDLSALRHGLALAGTLRRVMRAPSLAPAKKIAGLIADLGEHDTLVDRLTRALKPDLPALVRDGGFIAEGYSETLDKLATLRDESRRLVMALEARYREETKVASLKVKHNNVLGYFIEVTPIHAQKMGEPFIHRQTLAGAVRYTSVELGALEGKIASAAERALQLEIRLFADLAGEVGARADEIDRAARALARIDWAAALAELAVEENFCRPRIDDSLAFDIRGGRHPVVEAVADSGFVANDCDLDAQHRLWLITGPNMAGKSTFLRQNALIAILAQMGSFVPAKEAHIGIVDQLFSRVGAADDLARGRSTFLVEMVETAAILNQASERALVILDEIGRGTATFDGLSIAWASLEHVHEVNRCRALFATHYHELTALTATLSALSCHSMRVKEWRDKVIFQYAIEAGAANRSYGIYVARLAGLPKAVVARAEEVLATLESGRSSGTLSSLADDLPLFRAAPTEAPARVSVVEEALDEISPDELSPRSALEALYRLKSLRGGS